MQDNNKSIFPFILDFLNYFLLTLILGLIFFNSVLIAYLLIINGDTGIALILLKFLNLIFVLAVTSTLIFLIYRLFNHLELKNIERRKIARKEIVDEIITAIRKMKKDGTRRT